MLWLALLLLWPDPAAGDDFLACRRVAAGGWRRERQCSGDLRGQFGAPNIVCISGSSKKCHNFANASLGNDGDNARGRVLLHLCCTLMCPFLHWFPANIQCVFPFRLFNVAFRALKVSFLLARCRKWNILGGSSNFGWLCVCVCVGCCLRLAFMGLVFVGKKNPCVGLHILFEL